MLTDPSTYRRERLGYHVPVIDPLSVYGPSRVSLSPAVLGSNLLLALLCALIAGAGGWVLGHLQQTRPGRFGQVLGRLPFQALTALLLLWLIDRLIPGALAQGPVARSPVSLLRIPSAALLLFLVIGVSNTLFNTLLIEHGDRIHDAFRPLRERFGSGRDLRRNGWFIVLLILLYGLIGGYVNPQFHLLPGRELGIIFVTTVVVILSAYLKDLFSFFIAGRWRYPRWFQANLAGLCIAAACVALTREFALNPGYIYGIPVGLLIGASLDREREGLLEFLGFLWLLAVALVVWILGSLVMAYPVPSDLCNTLYVTLIEAVFIELLPLPRFAGAAVFRWKRPLWFLQFTVAVFLLFQTLFNPQGTVRSIAESPSAAGLLILLGCFATGLLVLWASVVWEPRKRTEFA
jgi:hypothetical protein